MGAASEYGRELPTLHVMQSSASGRNAFLMKDSGIIPVTYGHPTGLTARISSFFASALGFFTHASQRFFIPRCDSPVLKTAFQDKRAYEESFVVKNQGMVGNSMGVKRDTKENVVSLYVMHFIARMAFAHALDVLSRVGPIYWKHFVDERPPAFLVQAQVRA